MKKFKLSNIDIIKHDKAMEPHLMVNPQTGEEVEVTMQSQHDALAEKGFVNPNQQPQQYKVGGTHNADSTVGYSSKRKLKEGGEIDKYENMTGQYISELPTRLLHTANAEVEKDEYIKFPNGEVRRVLGETHNNGGSDQNLPNKTQILSASLKIGKDLAKELKAEHGLNVKATTPFDEALAMYTKKIGLDKINDAQAELFEMMDKQDEISDARTQNMNRAYINEKILKGEAKKEALNEEKRAMFDKLFERQEASKKPTPKKGEFKYGGVSESKIREIAERNGLSMEKAMFLLGGEKKGYYENGDEIDGEDAKTALDGTRYRPYDKSQSFQQQGRERLSMFGESWGLEPLPAGATDSEMRAYAGRAQSAAISQNPDLAADYMLRTSHRPNRKLVGIMKSKGYNVEGKSNEELNKMLRESFEKGDVGVSDIAEGFHDSLWDYRALRTDKQEVTPEQLEKIKSEHRGIRVGDRNYYVDPNDPDRYVEYTTKAAEPEAPADEPETDEPTTTGFKPEPYEPKGYVFPAAGVLPPGALEPHLHAKVRRGRIDPIKQGVESELQELNRQKRLVEGQLRGLASPMRAAALAGTLATTQGIAATAIRDVNRANVRSQQSADLFNVNQADTEQQLQQAADMNFEQRQLLAKAKTDREWQNYYHFLNRKAKNDYLSAQRLNMIDAITPDFTLDIFGQPGYFDPSYNNQLNQNEIT